MTGPKHLWSGDWEEESAKRTGGSPAPESSAAPTPGPDSEPPDSGSGQPPHRRNGLIAGAVTVAVLAIVAIVIASSGSSDPQAPTTQASASVPTTQSNPTQTTPTNPTQTTPTNPTQSTPTNPTQSTPTNPGGSSAQSPTTSASTPTVPPQPVSWLGMEVITVPNGTAVVDTVTPGGAGDLAGLNPADTITAINGKAITGSASIAKAVGGLHKGAVITLTIDRGGTTLHPQAKFTGPPTAYP